MEIRTEIAARELETGRLLGETIRSTQRTA
jgi:hypothetical protein